MEPSRVQVRGLGKVEAGASRMCCPVFAEMGSLLLQAAQVALWPGEKRKLRMQLASFFHQNTWFYMKDLWSPTKLRGAQSWVLPGPALQAMFKHVQTLLDHELPRLTSKSFTLANV